MDYICGNNLKLFLKQTKEHSSRRQLEGKYIFSPFLSSDRKEQIKQTVLRILQERDSTMTSATTEK